MVLVRDHSQWSCWIPIFFSDQPSTIQWKLAEGVGFEPTVGFPTLDFESSALNRTQPPFRDEKRTSNAERPISNVQRKYHADDLAARRPWLAGSYQDVWTWLGEFLREWRRLWRTGLFRLTRLKNVTILSLPYLPSVLHLVCPHGQPRYYLLLTAFHRFLAPLFTSIRNLLGTLNPPLLP